MPTFSDRVTDKFLPGATVGNGCIDVAFVLFEIFVSVLILVVMPTATIAITTTTAIPIAIAMPLFITPVLYKLYKKKLE